MGYWSKLTVHVMVLLQFSDFYSDLGIVNSMCSEKMEKGILCPRAQLFASKISVERAWALYMRICQLKTTAHNVMQLLSETTFGQASTDRLCCVDL